MSNVVGCLRSLGEWSKLSIQQIESSADELRKFVGGGFAWIGTVTYQTGINIVSFCHEGSGMTFNLIPGGERSLGLSDNEYKAVKRLSGADDVLLKAQMQVEQVVVDPFLISCLPVLEETAVKIVDLDSSLFRPDFQPLSGEKTGKVPIYLTRSEVQAVLSQYRFSLPTEAQWEYAVRGGTDSPFYFGSEIPGDAELSKIFNTDFSGIRDGSSNGFGIAGMLVGGWCKDTIRKKRWHGTDAGPPYVVRGGAGIYWPWQDTGEWMLAPLCYAKKL